MKRLKFLRFLLPLLIVAYLILPIKPIESVKADDGTVETQISANSDDCWLYASALILNMDQFIGHFAGVGLTDGFRFLNQNIPQYANITAAWLSFVASVDLSATDVNTTISGELNANPTTFTDATDFNTRSHTSASVNWSNLASWTTDSVYNSTDISVIIQEIVNLPAWASGNNLTLFLANNGSTVSAYREAYSHDNTTNKAAILHVEWFGYVSVAPTVQTDSATNVDTISATLNGAIIALNPNATSYGFEWGTSTGIYTDNWTSDAGNYTVGNYSHNATVQASKTSFYRFFATNSEGTGYGEEQNFTTTIVSSVISMSLIPGFSVTISMTATPVTTIAVITMNVTPASYNLTCTVLVTMTATPESPPLAPMNVTITMNVTPSSPTIPVVTTNPVTDYTPTSVTLHGTILDLGGSWVTSWGFALYYANGTYITTTIYTGNASIGDYSKNQTGLAINTYYKYYFFATNWYGTTNGAWVIFPTTAPTVITNSVTNITPISVMFHGAINNTYGLQIVYYGWQWWTPGNYTVWDSPAGNYTSGNYGYSIEEWNSLTPATLYYYRFWAVYLSGDYGIAYGSTLNFTTTAWLSYNITNLVAYPTSATQISLSWLLTGNLTGAVIRYQIGSYPSTFLNGSEAYHGSQQSSVLGGLTPGTTYYFSGWGYDADDNYSLGSAQTMATTPALYTSNWSADLVPDVSTAPDAGGLTGSPGYEVMSWVAQQMQISVSVWYMLMGLFAVCILVALTALKTKSIFFTVMVTVILMGALSAVGVFPMIVLYLIGIIGIAYALIKGYQTYA